MVKSTVAPARRACALLLALLPALSGCLVIEKKTLVMVVPPESKEARLYYVFEGLSVLDDKNATLNQASEQLDNLQRDDLSFFVNGYQALSADDSLVKSFRFEPLRFFRDPSRGRQLCADRRATITDREQFARELNARITDVIRNSAAGDVAQIRDEIERDREQLKSKDSQQTADAFGMRPFMKAMEGVLNLAAEFDADSMKRVKDAAEANDAFQWLRFEPETLRVVFPVTSDCARRIARGAEAEKWLKEMRSFVTPIRLEAGDEGLGIVLGGPGKPIRFTYTDPRPNQKDREDALMRCAGNPKPLLIDEKAQTAEMLVERFIAENKQKR
jgi:hypothetical protein